MLLHHNFTVDLPIEEAWAVFTDLPRIAPCFPGAELTGIEGDAYEGRMRVKVGPISAQYAGEATFVEQDATKHRAVISAHGRDSKGQGTASATITAQLQDEGQRTAVSVEVDLAITGKVAQFGRGALGDVSEQLLKIFLECLEHELQESDGPTPEMGGAEPAKLGRRATASDELNLNYVVFLPMLKRAAPTAVAIVVTAIVVRRLTSRS